MDGKKKQGLKRKKLRQNKDKSDVNAKAESIQVDDKKQNKKVKRQDDVDWEKIEREQNPESSESDSEDSSDEINLDGSIEHVSENYTFEFNDMREEFTNGVTILLKSILLNPTEAYNLASIVTHQVIVGTVINCEGENDSFAFATVIPLTQQMKKESPLYPIVNQLKTSISSHSNCKTLHDTLNSNKVTKTGIFLHRRFSNLPLQLIAPLHRNLEEDISWARQQTSKDSSNNNNNNSNTNQDHEHVSHDLFANLEQVILLSTVTCTGYDFANNKNFNVTGNANTIIFDLFEDECYFQHSISSILFKPPVNTCDRAIIAMIIPVSKIKNCIAAVTDMTKE